MDTAQYRTDDLERRGRYRGGRAQALSRFDAGVVRRPSGRSRRGRPAKARSL